MTTKEYKEKLNEMLDTATAHLANAITRPEWDDKGINLSGLSTAQSQEIDGYYEEIRQLEEEIATLNH